MGVVSECCCKEVYYRYPHNNYFTFPYSTCISSFFGIIPIFLFILKCFFVLYIYPQGIYIYRKVSNKGATKNYFDIQIGAQLKRKKMISAQLVHCLEWRLVIGAES